MKTRNPKWTKEELTLAYQTLSTLEDRKFSDRSPEIKRLSHLLHTLKIHPVEDRLPSFRDYSGVRARLSYLRRIENGQEVEGRDLYKEVVDKYRNNQALLERDAKTIVMKHRASWLPPSGCPSGNKKPTRYTSYTAQFSRDMEVSSWVIRNSEGYCECCRKPAPFQKEGGEPYLEVHHLLRLSDGGPDTVTNTVAVCPNCHRELHYGVKSEAILQRMYATIERLQVVVE